FIRRISTLRRGLIDLGYLARMSDGSVYWLKTIDF
ncbi:MAG: DUF2087 domain-containing protein, partial [Clostridiales bacterium]|nr:DUF2087 domain-containing protein [Clostridiales bacterium]